MARAAAKRRQRPKQPPRQEQPSRGKRDKALEEQLFFGRLRTHAKWVFLFLALVFAGSFVFLGVGSGNSGLGDVFSNIFSGGSAGPSVSSAQKKLDANPKDAPAALELAQALQGDGRTDEAIAAYNTYLRLRPRSLDGLNQLAALHEERARLQAAEAQDAAAKAQLYSPSQFGPDPASKLGRAFAENPDPIEQSLGGAANRRYVEALTALQETRRASLDVYRKIAALQPDEPAAQLQVAFAAEQAGDTSAAIAAYRAFAKRFPDDPSAATARQQIRSLEQQAAAAKTSATPAG